MDPTAAASAAEADGASVLPSIAYGNPANPGQFPSYVFLRTTVPGDVNTYGCGGVLVARNVVMTAGGLEPAAPVRLTFFIQEGQACCRTPIPSNPMQ